MRYRLMYLGETILYDTNNKSDFDVWSSYPLIQKSDIDISKPTVDERNSKL